MRLNLAAESTDWDAALASLDSPGADEAGSAPAEVDDEDVEETRFRELHGLLHEAVFSVLRASDNEIRYFE
jgi:hypothetical protein